MIKKQTFLRKSRMTREIGREMLSHMKLARGKAFLGDIKLVITLSLLRQKGQEPALAEVFYQCMILTTAFLIQSRTAFCGLVGSAA